MVFYIGDALKCLIFLLSFLYIFDICFNEIYSKDLFRQIAKILNLASLTFDPYQ